MQPDPACLTAPLQAASPPCGALEFARARFSGSDRLCFVGLEASWVAQRVILQVVSRYSSTARSPIDGRPFRFGLGVDTEVLRVWIYRRVAPPGVNHIVPRQSPLLSRPASVDVFGPQLSAPSIVVYAGGALTFLGILGAALLARSKRL